MAGDAPSAAAPRLDVARLAALPRPLLIAAIPALASLVLFAELPPRPYILHLVQKLGHPGVFALIAIAMIALQLQPRPEGRPWRAYLIAFLTAVAIGAATEVGQVFTHRDPAVADVGLDALGALCALALAAAFDRRVWDGWPRGTTVRLLAAALGLGLALAVLAPFAVGVLAYARRAYNFPVLFRADTGLDRYFLVHGRFTAETVAGADGGASRRVLRVPLARRPYDGVTIFEPSPDWRGFRALEVAVENPGAQPLDLTVRVDDRSHNGSFEDRYNGVFRVPPGARRQIEIALDDIEAAPRGRRLDLAHVGPVVIFRAGAGGPDAFLLERVTLR